MNPLCGTISCARHIGGFAPISATVHLPARRIGSGSLQGTIMRHAFGRRGSPEQAQKPLTNPEAEVRSDAAEVLFSPLMGRLAAVVGAVVLVVVLAGSYVSNMQRMGRAPDDSWSRKTIGQASDRDAAIMTRGPCRVRSIDPKFQEIQRQLGC